MKNVFTRKMSKWTKSAENIFRRARATLNRWRHRTRYSHR